jgi:hypothetical protein
MTIAHERVQVAVYFVALPASPLLTTLVACHGHTGCLSSEWEGAVWAVGGCVPLGVGAWMVLGSLAHVQRFGFTTMLFVSSSLCGALFCLAVARVAFQAAGTG